MSESPATILRAAATLMRERAEAATRGPWWHDEDDEVWRLHGVHAVVPAQLGGRIPEQVINHQIAKAPKQGTPYAEYWPNEADTAWITSMHPGTGLAIAAWLDATATDAGETLRGLLCRRCGGTVGDEDPSRRCRDWDAPLAVARAYLTEVPA